MTTRDTFEYWVRERENIRIHKEMGCAPPHTHDPILQQYSFCNVRREDDRVTRWLKRYWRDPHWNKPHFTPMMVLARMLNWPPTLARLDFGSRWDSNYILTELIQLKRQGQKIWGSAYVITTCGRTMDKAEYVVKHVCNRVADLGIKPELKDTLARFHDRLCLVDGLGAGFLAAQVVADLKHTPLLVKAPDWWTWAAPGPGSIRGLNRYNGLAPTAPMSRSVWDKKFEQFMINMSRATDDLELISAQDWQNVLCEVDKYLRTKNGEGRPKRNYNPEQASYKI